MRFRAFGLASLLAAGLVALVSLAAPAPAEASIHEIIAALCRATGEEVVPFGQNKQGTSFLRALQASGFLTAIDTSDPTRVVLHFDPTVPNSKYMSAGFDLTLEDEIAPGVDLVLSPLVIPDPSFPAHENCNFLQ